MVEINENYNDETLLEEFYLITKENLSKLAAATEENEQKIADIKVIIAQSEVGDLSIRMHDAEGEIANIKSVAAGHAPKESPAFTGTPTAPTANPEDNSTRIATTEFVHNAAASEAFSKVDSRLSEDWRYKPVSPSNSSTILWTKTGSTTSFDDVCDFDGTKITFRYGGEVTIYFSPIQSSNGSFSAGGYVKIYKNGINDWEGAVTKNSSTSTNISVARGDKLEFEYGFNNPTSSFYDNYCFVRLCATLEHVGFDVETT